ncbi:hypothetical protein COY62_04505 [bacterium (Candidatus Howlettbacteria) CG_4_10_14_0_8_um_filter_40_9]|nr:MAG: hypothetical protein COY62_04505 [bacterium (Candidatus Howlettbacteria) CG_4_10_14_0_8_um_filter_40_9]
MGKKRPRLSWKLTDYQNNNIEVSEDIEKMPHKTEGEMMDETDIEKWFTDIMGTFKVLGEQDEELFKELYECFVEDTMYLKDLGKISDKQAELFIEKDNFKL